MQTNQDSRPLAERMRPKSLDAYIGQEHLVGEGGSLRRIIESGAIPSMIFWGPPGVGKTTLASILSNTLKRPFHTLSAISSGVKDVREVIEKAKGQGLFGSNNSVLFIDEIHRFSKAQQDSLLGAVENGTITLIGATTENPSFEVISALLSRCQVYVLKAHTDEDLEKLLIQAINEDEILKERTIELKEPKALIKYAGGDARRTLNLLEICVQNMDDPVIIDEEHVKDIIKANPMMYDKDGEQHYDIISAFIKSVRGSDPNAAVYWLARMIEGGEDPKFIARRLLILASEDIGNANPTALVIASSCFNAVQVIGWPESRIILSQCTTYLASSPKSNAAYMAINHAQAEVRNSGNLAVPMHLRNAPTQLMKELGYGENYKYSHDFPNNFIAQEFMPDEIQGKSFYKPGNNPREQELAKRLRAFWSNKYDF